MSTSAGHLGAVDLLASPAEIRAIQDELLREQVQRLQRRHPYYRREHGAALDGVRSIEDLAAFPLTTKEDFATGPDDFRLEPVAGDVLWDVAYTSGSTSTPMPIYQTARDFRGILLLQHRMAEIRGISARDTIANLYPLTHHPHGAWLRVNHAAAALGASLVIGMGGARTEPYDVTRRTDEVLALLDRSQPTVFWGVPSHVKRLMELAVEQGLRFPGLRVIAVSGEACGADMAAALRSLAEQLGAQAVVSDSFGASELQGGMVECTAGAGFHNPVPELYYFEAVDESGGRVPDGASGRLAVTHLDRTGTALMRYILGDVVTYTEEPCDRCGRSGGRVVAHQGRPGPMTKVRGNLLDSRVLVAALEGLAGLGEFEVVVDHERPDDRLSPDVLIVRAVRPTAALDAAAIAEAVKQAVGVTPRVEIVDELALYDAQGSLKSRRFIDKRTRE